MDQISSILLNYFSIISKGFLGLISETKDLKEEKDLVQDQLAEARLKKAEDEKTINLLSIQVRKYF